MHTKFSPIRAFYTQNMALQPVPETAPAGTEVYYGDPLIAISFTGKAQKPAIYMRFRSAQNRTDYVNNWLRNITAREAEKAAKRQARKAAVCPFRVGDILEGSWGYEQTNREFWQITAMAGRKITLQECAHRVVEQTGWLSEMVEPGEAKGEIVTKIAQTWDGKAWYVRLHECCTLALWDGRPGYASHYA